MYRSGYCTVAGPPSIAVTSAEQLEESVNYDDLLVPDNILESLELSEVLDSQAGSYLRSLGTDGDCQLPSTNFHCSDRILPEFFNHFSPATRFQACEPVNSDQRLNIKDVDPRFHSSTPLQAYYTNSNCMSQDCLKGSTFQSCGQIGEREPSSIECTYFSESVPSTPIMPGTTMRPVSPSTFYNLSTVTRSHSDTVQDAQQLQERTQANWSGSSASCSRDGTTSDADSGIHSPESTPTKYGGHNTALGISRVDLQGSNSTAPNYSLKPALECGSALTDTSSRSNWNSQIERGVSMEVITMPAAGASDGGSAFHLDSREEVWERASVSSNASTLSVESETKLLNMDDCKTYVSHEVASTQRCCDGSQRDKCANYETESSINGIFVENNVAITTVYPTFIGRGCNSNSVPQISNGIPPVDTSVDSLQHQFSESSVGDGKLFEAKSNKVQPKKRHKPIVSNNTICNDVKRRSSYHGAETSFIDPYDLKIRRATGKSIHLWEFIRDTLLDPQHCPRLIKWEDRKSGIFRFVQSDVVAGMWGEKKNNPKMTYEKLSRAMRYYYNRGILERVDGRRLVYKFGRNAHGWQQFEGAHDARNSKQDTFKVKKEPQATSVFPRPTSRPAPKRKFAVPKIAVSVSTDIMPPVKKPRTLSGEKVPQYVSVVTNEHKSSENQASDELRKKIAAVQKSINLSNVKSEPQDVPALPAVPETATIPIASAEAPCIVYVARPEPMSDAVSIEKEVNVFEVPSWSPDVPSDRQAKLPSADVLLCKQFKLATAAV